MRKNLFLIVVLCSCLPAGARAFAYEKLSAELGTDVSYITYNEPGIEEKGAMYGVSGAVVMHNRVSKEDGVVIKADGRLDFGRVDYDGALSDGTPYQIKDINDLIAEVRAAAGYDIFLSEATRVTPYFGVGYRYLNDDISKDPAGYERESHYLYSPVGVDAETDLRGDWFLGGGVEFDVFWHGWQQSHLGDAIAAFGNVTNDQKGGYGVRASVRVGKHQEKADWFLEGFVRYWNVDESERANVTLSGAIIGTIVEPRNHSTEAGARVGVLF